MYFIDQVLLYSCANQLQKMKYKWVKSERTLLPEENLIHSLADIIITNNSDVTEFWKIIDTHKKVEWEWSCTSHFHLTTIVHITVKKKIR